MILSICSCFNSRRLCRLNSIQKSYMLHVQVMCGVPGMCYWSSWLFLVSDGVSVAVAVSPVFSASVFVLRGALKSLSGERCVLECCLLEY